MENGRKGIGYVPKKIILKPKAKSKALYSRFSSECTQNDYFAQRYNI